MPYTFAHIGYSLAFKKKWTNYFSTTGLAFGSIAPDYDILFRLTKNRFHLFQYNAFTILFIIFPLALVSAIAFHQFCRNILILHLPEPFQKKYEVYLSINFMEVLRKNYIRISVSILFAICLHLVLDFLCHYFDAFETMQWILHKAHNEYAGDIAYWGAIYFLPVVFSLAGFYLLAKFIPIRSFNLRDFALSGEKKKFWMLILAISLLISLIKLYFTQRELNFFIDFIVITVTSSFIISVYVVCTFYYLNMSFRKLN